MSVTYLEPNRKVAILFAEPGVFLNNRFLLQNMQSILYSATEICLMFRNYKITINTTKTRGEFLQERFMVNQFLNCLGRY